MNSVFVLSPRNTSQLLSSLLKAIITRKSQNRNNIFQFPSHPVTSFLIQIISIPMI